MAIERSTTTCVCAVTARLHGNWKVCIQNCLITFDAKKVYYEFPGLDLLVGNPPCRGHCGCLNLDPDPQCCPR